MNYPFIIDPTVFSGRLRPQADEITNQLNHQRHYGKPAGRAGIACMSMWGNEL